MWNGQPQSIDEVAVDFPELKLIVSHGGNGFGPPILAVAQRHPNVYLEFSALNPAYMAPEFLYATNTYLKNKCIFGSDYPLIDFNVAISYWKKVLRENVQALFFHQNILDALYKNPTAY
jgi:predicted TIM-barrel fold metal-dependent hydrolase